MSALKAKIEKISIVFPSSPFLIGQQKLIEEILENQGFEAKFFAQEFGKKSNKISKNINSSKATLKKQQSAFGGTSGVNQKITEFVLEDAKSRFLNLKKALIDKTSKIIWCGRGGYGSADLLPFLEKMPKPSQSKLIIGFSDITAIASFFIQKWNFIVLSAPMLAQIAKNSVSKQSQKEVFELVKKISSKEKVILSYEIKEILPNLPQRKSKILSQEKICGKLVGGCLSVLVSSFATNNQLDWRDKILFLEDIDESGARLDRYFNQIARMIKETGSKPKAILLGNFLQGIEEDEQAVKNVNFAIQRFANLLADFAQNSLPVFQEISGFLGHSKVMKPLFLGVDTVVSFANIENKSSEWQNFSQNPNKKSKNSDQDSDKKFCRFWQLHQKIDFKKMF